MVSGLKHRRTIVVWPASVMAMLASALLLGGCGGLHSGGAPGAAGSSVNPGVFVPNAQPYGKTYGEWGDEWWKWHLSIPKADNPSPDLTGEK